MSGEYLRSRLDDTDMAVGEVALKAMKGGAETAEEFATAIKAFWDGQNALWKLVGGPCSGAGPSVNWTFTFCTQCHHKGYMTLAGFLPIGGSGQSAGCHCGGMTEGVDPAWARNKDPGQ